VTTPKSIPRWLVTFDHAMSDRGMAVQLFLTRNGRGELLIASSSTNDDPASCRSVAWTLLKSHISIEDRCEAFAELASSLAPDRRCSEDDGDLLLELRAVSVACVSGAAFLDLWILLALGQSSISNDDLEWLIPESGHSTELDASEHFSRSYPDDRIPARIRWHIRTAFSQLRDSADTSAVARRGHQ